MEEQNKKEKLHRKFGLTAWALNNKNTVYLIIFVIVVFGAISYSRLPKELFPEVNWPTVYVQTIYPGNSPEDIENLISRQIEKECSTIKGVKEVRSTSAQDFSMVFIEFNSGIEVEDVLQDVKDAVDEAKSELPDDLLTDPQVIELDFSEFPVININLSGDYNLDELKTYAEYMQDELESIYEVSKVEIKGLNDKEIQVNIDVHKMEAFDLSFTTIENAIAYENMTVSGGEIKMGDTRRSIRIVGEFETVEELSNIVVKNENNNIVYLKDVAEVVDGYAEPKSFARLNHEPVVSLQVVKKSGENLLSCIAQVMTKLEEAKMSGDLPENLSISITNDQSENVKSQLDNLENSLLMGVILVVIVLFFFLGLRNATLVGIAIPMSMLLSFTVFGIMGTTINMIILFSLVLALGMLVDNAIVVVENIHRFIDEGYSIGEACKHATSEIAVPIIASTATTLAAFLPLAFWDDLMGEFMKLLPITLIIVLTSSLFVALVITPVIGSIFVKRNQDEKPLNKKRLTISSIILVAVAIVFYLLKLNILANLLTITAILMLLYTYILLKLSKKFQSTFLNWLENFYSRFIAFTLRKKRPVIIFFGSIGLMFLTLIFMGARNLDVILFPDNEPQYVNIIAELPSGTDVTATDSIMKIVENDISDFLVPYDKIVESLLTTVGEGVSRQRSFAIGTTSNKGLVTIKFVDYQYRFGISTSDVMTELTEYMNNRYPGMKIFVEKDANGPPTGNPINIELTGDDLMTLVSLSDTLINLINNSGIDGIEKLEIDIETGKPELIVNVDREKARRFGLSTGQIATSIRTSLFGKEVSDFKVGEDEYPIQLRFADEFRYNLTSLMNQKLAFRNNMGKLLKVPISAVADIELSNSFGQVKRLDQIRTITIFSNVIEGYNANRINSLIKLTLDEYDMPDGYSYSFTGEQEDMKRSMSFLMQAMLIAVALILIILVTQFNSIIKPLIIMFSVMLSTIGVFGGIATFKMDMVIIMTGIGIISLAGVVVNNAIVLIDYIDFLKLSRKKELGLEPEDNLPLDEIVPLIAKAGQTRLRPVLLTAITTILGLLPMAIGVNINFKTALADFNPDIFFGGDNAAFWGPMSWTVIFGLTFATFLTLVVVPSMYLIGNRIKLRGLERRKNKNKAILGGKKF